MRPLCNSITIHSQVEKLQSNLHEGTALRKCGDILWGSTCFSGSQANLPSIPLTGYLPISFSTSISKKSVAPGWMPNAAATFPAGASKVPHRGRQLSEAALFLSAFQTSLQQKSFVFKLVATKPERVFCSNVPFTCHTMFLLLRFFFFFRMEKMQLAFPDATFPTVTNILTEAYLFTLSLPVPRGMPFTVQ